MTLKFLQGAILFWMGVCCRFCNFMTLFNQEDDRLFQTQVSQKIFSKQYVNVFSFVLRRTVLGPGRLWFERNGGMKIFCFYCLCLYRFCSGRPSSSRYWATDKYFGLSKSRHKKSLSPVCIISTAWTIAAFRIGWPWRHESVFLHGPQQISVHTEALPIISMSCRCSGYLRSWISFNSAIIPVA